MTTIDKIRAEIDKWDDSIKDAIGEYADGMRFVLRHFTFVLDTLEEPVSEDLEKEIDAYYKEWDGDCRYAQTAHHFAQWGAEHFRGVTKMVSEDQPLLNLEIPAGDVAPAEEEGGPWEEDEQ